MVFGGTSGIGLAAVKRLAALGAEVVAISRDPNKATDLPDGVSTMACDVLDREAMETVLTSCGPIDILVSSATGGSRSIGPFIDMDMDGFQGSFDKLWGYANVVRYGTHHLADDGTIVLVSGSPASRTKAGQTSLGAVGAAVEQMARAVAPEIAPKRLNVVSPGIIDTPINPLEGEARDNAYRSATAGNLIPRAGTADEVAHAIVFAIENEFMTGNVIDVDGGWLLA